MLIVLKDNSELSIAELAERLGWHYRTGEPNKSLADRTLKLLIARKLVDKGPPRALTRNGKKAAKAAVEARKAKDEGPM